MNVTLEPVSTGPEFDEGENIAAPRHVYPTQKAVDVKAKQD